MQGDPEKLAETIRRIGIMWLKHITQDSRYKSLISVRMSVDKDGILEVSAQYLNKPKKVTQRIVKANSQLPSYELTWFDLLPMRVHCYLGGSFLILGACVIFSLTSVVAAMVLAFYVPVFAYQRIKKQIEYRRWKQKKYSFNIIVYVSTLKRILCNHWFSLIYMTSIGLTVLYLDFILVKLFCNRLGMIAKGLRLQKRLMMWIRTMVR